MASGAQSSDDAVVGAQQRRTEETKAALLSAARTVLKEQGFARATVAQIVRAAGRAHGTFYLYFTNKEDIYSSLLDDVWDDLNQQSRAVWRREDPVESVRETVGRYVRSYGENVELWQLLLDMSAVNPHFRIVRDERRRQFVRKIQHGVEGSLSLGETEGMRTDILAELLAAMVDEICSVRFLRGRTWSVPELVDHITTVWARAVGYEEGAGPAGPLPQKQTTLGITDAVRPRRRQTEKE